MNHLFTINDLEAGYLPGKPVLQINELNLPKNKLIFLLGKSGIGKSTLLELLGLMNNTLMSNEEQHLQFQHEHHSIDYANLWQGSENNLANFRNQNFSFIFQNENLMHNFTAGENVCFAQMIQGKTFKAAKAIALNLMDQLGIEKNKFDEGISAFSGGQRQRLSFIRAISTDYTILFGDEPTGNLDSQNAHNLMSVMKQDMMTKQASAILVSHDIDLGMAFADQIIVLTEKKVEQPIENTYATGEILAEHIYHTEDWKDKETTFKKHIERLIK